MSRERDVVHTLGAEASLPRAARPMIEGVLLLMEDIKEGRRAMLRGRVRRLENEKWKCGGFRGARRREVIWAGVGAWIPWHLPSAQSQHLHFAQLFQCRWPQYCLCTVVRLERRSELCTMPLDRTLCFAVDFLP
jgi:hypothetical protein